MPPKIIKLTASGQEIKEAKYKAPVKPYIEKEWLTEYRRHRDICYFIQHGGECLWSDEEIQEVRNKYFREEFKETLF